MLSLRIEPGKLGPAHMDQSRVVTTLKIQLLLLGDAVVDDHVQPIARAHRRNRAGAQSRKTSAASGSLAR